MAGVRGLVAGVRRWVTVEPLVLLATVTFGAYITQQGVYREKVREEVCSNCTAEQEEEVERRTSEFIRNCSVVETVLELVVMVVAGHVSDRVGRKGPLLWSVVVWAASLASLATLLGVEAGTAPLPLTLYYLPSLLYGLSGGAFTMFVLTFSFLGDLSTREQGTRLVGGLA